MYIQHSYNKVVHTSPGKCPFETCFGCFSPSPLDIIYGKKVGVREDLTRDTLRAKKFIEKITQIHLQVQETLHKLHDKCKGRHEQHRTKKSFMAGDRVQIQLNKERL